jgi:uncharacterized protein (DUF1778 family)
LTRFKGNLDHLGSVYIRPPRLLFFWVLISFRGILGPWLSRPRSAEQTGQSTDRGFAPPRGGAEIGCTHGVRVASDVSEEFEAVEDNSRMSLRIRAEEKALLMRAVALNHTDLTEFVVRHALRAAKAVIEEADRVPLSARDSVRVLDLLANPPAPNARLRAAARALPRRS